MSRYFQLPSSRYHAAFAGLLLAAMLSGCGKPGDAVAKVNGEWVSEAEFKAYLDHKRIRLRDDAHRERVLDEYLNRIAMAEVIDELDSKDRASIEAELLENRREILIHRHIDTSLRGAVTDDVVRKFYDDNLQEFSAKRVHAAHILTRTNREMKEPEKQAKLTAIREAHGKLVAGEDFAALAQTYSEDLVSGKKGGDLGWLKQDAVDPAFAEAVAKLKPGEYSGPVETKFGFHIIKLLEGPVVQQRDFESAQGEIRYRLRNEARDKLMESIRDDVKIEKVKVKAK